MIGGEFCEYDSCKESYDELQICCVLCGEKVFCSETCQRLGMLSHTQIGCDQKKIHTPRSVLGDVIQRIQKSPTARKILFEKFKNGQAEKGLGLLLITVKDMNNVCEMINYSVYSDIGEVLANMASFESVNTVDESIKTIRGGTICDDSSFILVIKSLKQGSIFKVLPL